jgi:hypothetical protein
VTSTVNEVSKALLGLADYDLISLRIDSIAVGLLIVLLAAFVLVVVVRIFDVR